MTKPIADIILTLSPEESAELSSIVSEIEHDHGAMADSEKPKHMGNHQWRLSRMPLGLVVEIARRAYKETCVARAHRPPASKAGFSHSGLLFSIANALSLPSLSGLAVV